MLIDAIEPSLLAVPLASAGGAGEVTVDRARLSGFLDAHYALIWRTVRRFGVGPSRADEAVSRVLDVVVRRLDGISPDRERSFVVQVCLRVASEFRRAEIARARREAPVSVERLASDAPSPEEALVQKEARAQLDYALNALAPDVRAVFVLYELEQWTTSQIAESLGVPRGTVASRLRRARAEFAEIAVRLRQRPPGVLR